MFTLALGTIACMSAYEECNPHTESSCPSCYMCNSAHLGSAFPCHAGANRVSATGEEMHREPSLGEGATPVTELHLPLDPWG